MAELLGVELARPGSWDLAIGGKTEFSIQMLRDAADFFTVTGSQPIPVGLGHLDDRFDGDPAFGWVENVRYAEDVPGHDPGPVLLGDVKDVPDWLHAAAPSRWPNRSVEGVADINYDGRTYSLALTRLAFLGTTPPAMRNLRSLRHVQEALAAAQRIAASAPITTPAAPAEVPPNTEGASMSLANYREALAGLPDTASEDEVKAALAAAGLVVASAPTEPAPPPTPTPEPAPKPEPEPQQDTAKLVAAAQRGGVVTIDAATVAQFQEGMLRAAGLAKKMDEQERDTLITEAIKAGKFPPARRGHYENLWKADPDGARQIIASLAANLVPVTATGYAGDGEDAIWDAEFRGLFPPTYGRSVHRG